MVIWKYITLIDRWAIQLFKTIIASDNLFSMLTIYAPVITVIASFIYDSFILKNINIPKEEINKLENHVKKLSDPIESMKIISPGEYQDLIDDLKRRSDPQIAMEDVLKNSKRNYRTIADVYNSMADEEKNIIFKIIGEQLNE